ncbi:MAG: tetrahydromethanopterin synthesis protein [Methylibium sp. NZG]|nr:MAG: tetrahydromethanopterin synthesis protein [Methylibium sp. NZG]
MNDVIYECVVTSVSPDGQPHVAPMGVRYRQGAAGEPGTVVLMPFVPSTTLANIVAVRHAVLNIVLDTRVFAGCVTGRKAWPALPAERVPGVRLQAALSHIELRLESMSDEPQRPVLQMARVHEVQHAPLGGFFGFNRAQSAVIEGAVLVSRLHMLPPEKVSTEMAYLQIAIDKTAGPEEHEAWGWLQDAVAHHRAAQKSTKAAP